MKNVIIVLLILALGVSWWWFLTHRPVSPEAPQQAAAPAPAEDTVSVWVNELVGSPDETHFYELAGLWNATHTDVKIKMSAMSHAGYESKLRVAIASGQPPDVCMSGFETLENLKYTGKSLDLAVPIPESIMSKKELEAMGPLVEQLIVRDGRPTIFPIYRYCYGGVILANRKMLRDAGYDDEQIRRDGWTFDQFRDACRKMTRDLDGDGAPDTWGFGAALVHLEHLLMDEFGPGVWGREIARERFLARDEATGKYVLEPALTEEHIYQVFLLFHQLLNEDKTWNPAYLGMDWNEINDELIKRGRLGMTFGETPWVVKLRMDIWASEQTLGAKVQGPPPDLTVLWMPTLKPGDRPAPRAGVMGFSVLKQESYKGDAHTENALRVALYLTHPVHLARSQLRGFRHLPPDPVRFGRIFPELLQKDDPGVQFYNSVMNSDIPIVSLPPAPTDPSRLQYLALGAKMDRWLEKKGMDYLQQVIYGKLTLREAAKQFYEGLKEAAAQDTELPIVVPVKPRDPETE